MMRRRYVASIHRPGTTRLPGSEIGYWRIEYLPLDPSAQMRAKPSNRAQFGPVETAFGIPFFDFRNERPRHGIARHITIRA